MKNLLLMIFLILLSFINCSFTPLKSSKAEETVDQLLKKIEIALSKKYDMKPIAVGASMPCGVVKKLQINFQIERSLSKEQLRTLIVHATKDFVDLVNANKNIKSFLERDPFEIKNVEMDIFVIGSNCYVLEHPHIGIAGIRNGKIDYSTSITVNNIPKDVTEEWETYEEAIKILQEQAANKTSLSE